MDKEALKGVDTIIHLAGAGIADKRWTNKRKREILESRTKSTALLFQTLASAPHQVKTVISASAIGYYGGTLSSEWFDESSEGGHDFLAEVVKQWESEAAKITELGIRLVRIRIGVVLSREGGALREMVKPIQWGVGAALGSGRQWMSWIHGDDLCRIFAFCMENERLSGVFNAVSPSPVTNVELTKAIARVLKKRILLPAVPAVLLRLALGEMANLVILGNRVSSEKIRKAGYSFKHDELNMALHDLLDSPGSSS